MTSKVYLAAKTVNTSIRNFVKNCQIAYAIGITSAFEIADDEEMKSLYLANADRFIMHGTNGDK